MKIKATLSGTVTREFKTSPQFFLAALFGLPINAGILSSASAADTTSTISAVDSANTRYGLFDALDHRSVYGDGVYPEPFFIDDSDLEVNEFRVDWLHTEAGSQNTNLVTAEVEKGFGLLTVEIEAPYERDTSRNIDQRTSQGTRSSAEGIGNISLGARCPVYQYVTADGTIDTTFGVGFEVGIPTNSPVSKNTEVVPKIFNDLAIGDHFTIQSVVGYSTLYGGGDDGNLETFEYGFVFGWTIQHHDLPLPGIKQLIPVAELSGELEINKDDPGHNSLVGDVGFRVNLNAIGRIQPRLGMVYVFPIDKGGREDIQWGIDTSLVFEF